MPSPHQPYVFTPHDGPEAFTQARTAPRSGRLLTWYGPAMVGAQAARSRSSLSKPDLASPRARFGRVSSRMPASEVGIYGEPAQRHTAWEKRRDKTPVPARPPHASGSPSSPLSHR